MLKMFSTHRHGLGVAELARHQSVSEKTIRRDLQVLKQLGFPLEERTGEFGKKTWHALDLPGIPGLNFNLTEVMSLYLARRFLEPLIGTQFWDGAFSAFNKIRATFSPVMLAYFEKLAGVLYQSFEPISDYSQHSESIDSLLRALEDRQVVILTYRSQRVSEAISYDVHPYGMVLHKRAFYLVAYAPNHGEIRHYKIDRVEHVEVTTLQFPRPAGFNLEDHFAGSFGVFHGDGALEVVRIWFSPHVARYVAEKRWHPTQTTTRNRDGSLTVEFRLNSTEELKRWLLTFGPQAIVLAPASLRNEIAAELQQTLAAYEKVASSQLSVVR